MNDEHSALLASIEALYRPFARYPLGKHVEGCPCCVRVCRSVP